MENTNKLLEALKTDANLQCFSMVTGSGEDEGI